MDSINIEDQVQNLENAILKSRGNDAIVVEELCNELIELGQEHRINAALGFAFYFKGENYFFLGDGRSCVECMIQGLGLQQSEGQWVLASRSYNLLAVNASNQGNAPFAIEYYLLGLDCCKRCEDKEEEARIHSNLGFLYLQYSESAKSIKHAKEAINIYEEMPESDRRNRNLVNADILLANACLLADDLEEALRCRKAVSELEFQKDNTIKIMLHILDLRLSDRMGGPEIYERKLKDLLRICQRDIPMLEVADELLEFSKDLLKLKRYEELEELLAMLMAQLDQSDILHLRIHVLRLQLEYFEETGQKEALAAFAVYYYQLIKRQEQESKYLMIPMDLRTGLSEREEN